VTAGLIDMFCDRLDRYRELRRRIHANPELGFEEVATANLIAGHLQGLGIDVTCGIGRTGVVGTLTRGTSRRSIGLRADMDALPVQEHNTFPHRSRRDGCFHGCGHDGHVVMLLAAAEYLAGAADFDGTVHLIFQPAEEGLGGGRAMIEDGLFQRFPCDAVYGMHNWPLLDVGRFATRAGEFLASSDTFDVVIEGRGGHAAFPELANNPLTAGAAVLSVLEDINQSVRGDDDGALLTVTEFHAGNAYNVIPQAAVIRGGVRSFAPERQDAAESQLRQGVAEIAARFALDIEVTYQRIYPVLVNSSREAEIAVGAAAAVVGNDNVVRDFGLIKGSEDFSFMLRQRPGCYILIGAGRPTNAAMCHDPGYDFNDEIIPYGASYWVRLVESM